MCEFCGGRGVVASIGTLECPECNSTIGEVKE